MAMRDDTSAFVQCLASDAARFITGSEHVVDGVLGPLTQWPRRHWGCRNDVAVRAEPLRTFS
jgi:hypothetical protein